MDVAVAAVVEVFSFASMLNLFAPRMDVPPSLMSKVGLPDVEAVDRLARTAVTVIAKGIRNVTFAVPVVRAVVSSEIATARTTGSAAHFTPADSAESAVRRVPFAPTFTFAGVDAADAAMIDPLAEKTELATAPTSEAEGMAWR
jgi:hypothetical protein